MTVENFKIVSEVRYTLSPGKCAKCEEVSQRKRVQVLVEYFDGDGYLTEPFNICRSCFKKY